MPIAFDPDNKYILITSPTTITTALSIYSTVMEWADDQENMDSICPMRAVGKNPMGGGVFTDSIFILQYGWKIKPWSGNYQLVIQGTVITDDESRRTVSPDSGNVDIIFQVSSFATNLQLDAISDLEKIAKNRWKIENNQLIIYDDDGVTPLRVFNLSGGSTPAYSERMPA